MCEDVQHSGKGERGADQIRIHRTDKGMLFGMAEDKSEVTIWIVFYGMR